MTIYKCECGEEQKDILKATIVLREGKWVAKEALCSCNKYMNSEPVEGMPNLRRTEASLSKNRDKLWEGAKEKLTGERGINEPFK
jgi:hypothetical protein|tara:strand:- start:707 stop:961 length:255 start_codon:yes stop_codon:yes gene_type:complete